MKYKIFSYRFAEEIIEHPNYISGLAEIKEVIAKCPLFTFPGKSKKMKKLDVVQQLFNTYFDRRFVADYNWKYHPSATKIEGSGLTADYSKEFKGLRIHAEVQFGNMARWYSDIFKFQTAYSQNLIDMGLCIVPMLSLASRMDSNVTNFERCIKELPSAKLSITLPILVIGIEPDDTPEFNVSKSGFKKIKDITSRGKSENRLKIVNGILENVAIEKINRKSPTGPLIIDSQDDVEDLLD